MNTSDVLKYGHLTIMEAIKELPEADWYTPGVCGYWSVKDIMAHLISFEHMLIDVLNSLQGEEYTPTLDAFVRDAEQFNQDEVAKRCDHSVAYILAQYETAYAKASVLLSQIPVEGRRVNGALEWYGAEYDLEDFITYAFYGHKREHAAQINVFRDMLAQTPVVDNQVVISSEGFAQPVEWQVTR